MDVEDGGIPAFGYDVMSLTYIFFLSPLFPPTFTKPPSPPESTNNADLRVAILPCGHVMIYDLYYDLFSYLAVLPLNVA